MATPLHQVSFAVPTTNTDGSTITGTLTYNVFIDTVNPPVKSFAVPAAEIAAAVAGVITATFAQLGFVPVNGTAYFAGVEAIEAEGTVNETSVMSSPIATFTYAVAPNAPTGFSVA